MTATSQPFMASDMLSTSGFFSAAISGDESVDPFESSFKAGTAALDHGYDSQLRHDDQRAPDFAGLVNNTTIQPMKANDFSPLFGFSPRMSPTPYEGQQILTSKMANVPAPRSWAPSKPENQLQLDMQPAVQLQAPSPPNSAKHSPDQWQFNDLPRQMFSPVHQIITQTHTGRTRTEHGQITPPNSRSPEDGDSHRGEQEKQLMDSGRAGKRKRGFSSSRPAEVADKNPSKRRRKSASSSKSQSIDAFEDMGLPVEDAKRSKFLERNRVAASKCRQKKKEWTSNLEVRARDLQASKNQLTVIVGSLKEEILFLKGELLKHSTCGCTAIREYLNREVASMSQPVYDRGHLAEKTRAASITPKIEDTTFDDDQSCPGTVVDDDGTATSPVSTQVDSRASSAVAAGENIDKEEQDLDELMVGHDSNYDISTM